MLVYYRRYCHVFWINFPVACAPTSPPLEDLRSLIPIPDCVLRSSCQHAPVFSFAFDPESKMATWKQIPHRNIRIHTTENRLLWMYGCILCVNSLCSSAHPPHEPVNNRQRADDVSYSECVAADLQSKCKRGRGNSGYVVSEPRNIKDSAENNTFFLWGCCDCHTRKKMFLSFEASASWSLWVAV